MVPLSKAWKIEPPSPDASKLARAASLTPLQAQILINRGISDTKSALCFLTPRLGDMADPMLLKDMGEATSAVLEAMDRGENYGFLHDRDFYVILLD